MKTPNPLFQRSAAALAALGLIGCSSGVPAATTVAPAPAPVGAASVAAAGLAAPAVQAVAAAPVIVPVTFRFRMPARAQRSLKYVSDATESLTVQVDTGTVYTFDVGETIADAVATSNRRDGEGGNEYEFTVEAPAGNGRMFHVNAYAEDVPGTTKLSTVSVAKDVVEGAHNELAITLGGVIASIDLTAVDATPQVGGEAKDHTINVVAKDASEACIMGTFDGGITLSYSGPSGYLDNYEFPPTAITESGDVDVEFLDVNSEPTTITATSVRSGAITDEATLTPRVEAVDVEILDLTPAVLDGETTTLMGVVTYSDDATGVVEEWAASDVDIATVATDTGVVTGVAVGETTFTAIASPCDEPVTASVDLRVFDLTVGASGLKEVEAEIPVEAVATAPTESGMLTYAWSHDGEAASGVFGDASDLTTTFEVADGAADNYKLTMTVTDEDGYEVEKSVSFDVLAHLDFGSTEFDFYALDETATAAADPEYGDLTFSIVDDGVATATFDGAGDQIVIDPIATGTTELTITAPDGREKTVDVYVTTTSVTIK